MLCSNCYRGSGSDKTAAGYSFNYSSDAEQNKKIQELSSDTDITFVADKFPVVVSDLLVEHTVDTDKKVCTTKYYQPTEASSYEKNYRFGGQSGIKVFGAFG